MTGDPDPKTEELKLGQERREHEERDRARASESEDEASEHARRAEKSGYLKEKLEKRAESERLG
jgi:hypothetical protein